MFEIKKNVETNAQVRVFGYTQARELTEEELNSVDGGRTGTSYCDTGTSCAGDDCTASN